MSEVQLVALSKKQLETLSIDGLPEAQRNQIMSIKNGIVMDYESTLNYASDASKNLTEFSSDLLHMVKVKDMPEVEGLIDELLTGLEKVDSSSLMEKKKGLFQRFFGGSELKTFIARYEDVDSVISNVKGKLEESNFQLKKDIEVCNRYYEQNIQYIAELDNYIMAGKLKVQEENEELDKMEQDIDKEDLIAVQEYNRRKGERDRMERKLYDLSVMRAVAIQNIPQLALIRNGDAVLVEKIQSSINTAIPLWESQMVIAIQLLRQKGALAIQQGVSKTTNNLLEKNNELLMSGSVEIAKELEQGVVDVNILKKNSENLIKTLQTLREVHKNGVAERENATRELAQLQIKLNETLMLSDGR